MFACLAIPYFAAAIERRDDRHLEETPLTIGGHPWETRPVYAFSQEGARHGLRPGISLRQAHVLFPGATFLNAHAPRYQGASGEVTDLLTDVTPLVAPADLWQPGADPLQRATRGGRALPAWYTLDLEGLPPDEALALVRHVGQTVRAHTRLAAAIGLAAQPFAAQVAASLARPHHVRPVPPAETAPFLAGRPLSYLPLEGETRRRLRLLGIRTLGQFAALPSSAVRARFGPAVAALQRRARGEAEHPLSPHPPDQVAQVTHAFDEPILHHTTLVALLDQAAERCADQLQKEGLAGREVHVAWETEDGMQEQQRSLRRSLTAPGRLATVLAELLSETDLVSGITGVTVTVAGLVPAVPRQLALFAPAPAAEAAEVVAALAARHGPGPFSRPALAERGHPLPERRFHLRGLAP